MEARKRREAAEEALIAARLQLQQGEDAQLDAATRGALEGYAHSANGALSKALRSKVCNLLALDRQRRQFAKAKLKRAASGVVVPPNPGGVEPLLNAERPWTSACPAVRSAPRTTVLSSCHPAPPHPTSPPYPCPNLPAPSPTPCG